MTTSTANIGLKKITSEEVVNIDKITNENMDLIDEHLGEVENKKINYTDLTPVITTGTSSDYVATIPTNIVEVTIVPHVNNLVGATLNGIAILDREGKPVEKDTLKTNIPTKLVRVGSNFFIASGGGGKEGEVNFDKTQDITSDNYNTFYGNRFLQIKNSTQVYEFYRNSVSGKLCRTKRSATGSVLEVKEIIPVNYSLNGDPIINVKNRYVYVTGLKESVLHILKYDENLNFIESWISPFSTGLGSNDSIGDDEKLMKGGTTVLVYDRGGNKLGEKNCYTIYDLGNTGYEWNGGGSTFLDNDKVLNYIWGKYQGWIAQSYITLIDLNTFKSTKIGTHSTFMGVIRLAYSHDFKFI